MTAEPECRNYVNCGEHTDGDFCTECEKERSLVASRETLEQQYSAAIKTLLPVAMKGTSTGRAAAQVLLSTYNGYEFHLDATDLCLFDYDLFSSAITVLQLRAVLMREPHEMVENGDERFMQVWHQWESLRLRNRYKQDILQRFLEGIEQKTWNNKDYTTAAMVIRKELEASHG